jgi:signal transduction histidine kinase
MRPLVNLTAWSRQGTTVTVTIVVGGGLAVAALGAAGRSVWPPLLLGAALVIFVTLRRYRPRTVLGLLLGGSVVAVVSGVDPGALLILPVAFVLGVVAVEERPRVAVIATAATLVVAGAEALLPMLREHDIGNIAPTLLLIVIAWTAGEGIRQRRAHLAELRARAVTEERLRIAREMHDVVAHGMSVIAVQAGFGRHVIDTQPASARTALDTIGVTSREVIGELRNLLGILRQDVPESLQKKDTLHPLPCLADLDRLVTSTAGAGVHPHVERAGRPRALPGGVELSAYRIIQEALTNVVRHAATGSCRVLLDYRDDSLGIEVTDRGRGGPVRHGGHGLIGLRERVALHGGEFEAGPLPAGGFRVAARLPAEAPAL